MKHLIQFLPEEYEKYWEPFLGAGSLFFAIAPKRAYLADRNEELIACFQAIRNSPALVFQQLQEHVDRSCAEYYYQTRSIYNTSSPSIAKVARFLYLNRAGFNGIYRVNRKGEYNVPYGHKEPPPSPSLDELTLASEILQSSTLLDTSYEATLASEQLVPGDFVYLDPPYPRLNGTSYFAHYTASRFSWEDHLRVAEVAQRTRSRGCSVMVSNSDIASVRSLYEGWHLHSLPVRRSVAANGRRYDVSELLITSYPVAEG